MAHAVDTRCCATAFSGISSCRAWRPLSWSRIVVLLAVASLVVLGSSDAQEWIRGHATYFGASDEVSTAYDGVRGKGSFGQLEGASCGYTERPDGVLPFARSRVAALGDTNPDYPGSCGRCYEVKCHSGIVYVDPETPVRLEPGIAIIGDEVQPSLSDVNAGVKDSQGRAWPGNPYADQGVAGAVCWSEDATIVVRIIGMPHMDLSYWAFEELAHPVFGNMMIDFRPVDCHTNQPVSFVPAYISRTIYGDGIEAGWGWAPYKVHTSKLRVPGVGPDGAPATCVDISPKGGLTFTCKEGWWPGVQPFAGASSIQFWIQSDTQSDDEFASSTPRGQVPPLKLFLMNDEENMFCKVEVQLEQLVPAEQRDDWYRLVVPISTFECEGYIQQKQIDRVDFQNPGMRDAQFCLAKMFLAA